MARDKATTPIPPGWLPANRPLSELLPPLSEAEAKIYQAELDALEAGERLGRLAVDDIIEY